MKRIYGFKVENPEEWGDVFENEAKSPEVLISAACHMYYDMDGNVYIGFDSSLGMSRGKMDELLSPYTKKPALRKVI